MHIMDIGLSAEACCESVIYHDWQISVTCALPTNHLWAEQITL